MADMNRSSPERAAELAAILALYLAQELRVSAHPHRIAKVAMAMQKAARSAKRQAEHVCNKYGYRDDAHEARGMRRRDRVQEQINEMLRELVKGAEYAPTVELGGDPRGPCAWLKIPGQRGDGWGGEGYAIY